MTHSLPKVSIIIPCFNQGQYIDEAVDSVLAQTFQDLEIIIVNDGSTDESTNKILEDYSKPKTKIVKTTNQGLARARNNGIKEAKGKYILPLDSDDKIGPDYIRQAIEVLENRENVKVVFANGRFFGAKDEKLELYYYRDDIFEYDVSYLLTSNFIYCTALFRKKDYDKTYGYNPNMKYGWEDWDLWLSILKSGGVAFKLIDEHFYYRVHEKSMLRNLKEDQQRMIELRKQIYLNHQDLYNRFFSDPIYLFQDYQKLETKLNRVLNSKAFKLGSLILKPLKYLLKYYQCMY